MASVCGVAAVACGVVVVGRCRVLDALHYYPPGICVGAPSVRFIVALAAVGAAVATIAAALVVRHSRFIERTVGDAARDVRRAIGAAVEAARADPPNHWISLGAIVLIGIAVRILLLDQPIRYDEAYTQLFYVQQPLIGALSDYSHPNNHLLHTALAKLTTRLLGDDPRILRIPALVTGILVIPATYVAGRALAGRTAALVATALVAASSEMVLYSTNARGYTMVALATLCLIVFAEWWRHDATPVSVVLMALAAGLGVIAVPVIVYPVAAMLTWLAVAVARREARATARQALGAAVAFGCLTTVIAAAGYSLVVLHMGWRSLLIGRDLWAVDSWSAVPAAIATFVGALWTDWTAGMPRAVALASLVLLVAGIVPRARIGRSRLGLPLTLLLVGVVVLILMRAVPPTRGWLVMLPFAAIAIGEGLDRLAGSPPLAMARARIPTWSATLLALLLGANVLRSRSVLDSDATGTLADGDAIARWLAPRLASGARASSSPPTGTLLLWHFGHLDLPRDRLVEPTDTTSHLLVIVNERHGQSLDRVLAAQRVDRSHYSPPDLVHRFSGASVYEMRWLTNEAGPQDGR